MVSDSILALFSQPLVGVVFGIAWAFLLFHTSRLSFRRMTPEAALEGLVVVALSLFARLALTTALLWAYSRFAADGYPAFGLSMAFVFLFLFGVEAIRYAGLPKRRRPSAGAAKGGR